MLNSTRELQQNSQTTVPFAKHYTRLLNEGLKERPPGQNECFLFKNARVLMNGGPLKLNVGADHRPKCPYDPHNEWQAPIIPSVNTFSCHKHG